MNKLIYILTGLLCLCGCRPQSLEPETAKHDRNDQAATRLLTEDDLQRMIRAGMSKQALDALFGEPFSTMEGTDGMVRFSYFLPVDESPGTRRILLSGFSAVFKDDKLFSWGPSYTSTGSPAVGHEKRVRVNPPEIKVTEVVAVSFWLVSEEVLPGGRYIDTATLPKLGYIPAVPVMVVRHLVSLEEGKEEFLNRNKQTVEHHLLYLQFTAEDAAAFEKLTAANAGKHLLTMVGDLPVVAPLILGPYSANEIVVASGDKQQHHELRQKLAQLLQ